MRQKAKELNEARASVAHWQALCAQAVEALRTTGERRSDDKLPCWCVDRRPQHEAWCADLRSVVAAFEASPAAGTRTETTSDMMQVISYTFTPEQIKEHDASVAQEARAAALEESAVIALEQWDDCAPTGTPSSRR